MLNITSIMVPNKEADIPETTEGYDLLTVTKLEHLTEARADSCASP